MSEDKQGQVKYVIIDIEPNRKEECYNEDPTDDFEEQCNNQSLSLDYTGDQWSRFELLNYNNNYYY